MQDDKNFFFRLSTKEGSINGEDTKGGVVEYFKNENTPLRDRGGGIIDVDQDGLSVD